MTDDEIIDRLLAKLNLGSPVLFWSAYNLINSTHDNVKIEAILDEMLREGLIKEDPSGSNDLPMVILTKHGLDILAEGGWQKHRFNSLTDGQKIHGILEYMCKKDSDKFDWTPHELMPAFGNRLEEGEVQALCFELIDQGDVADNRSNDGFSVGSIDRTKAAWHRKKYLRGQKAMLIDGLAIVPGIPADFSRQNEIRRYFNTPYVDSKIKMMNESITKDTDIALGTAKELLETTCKSILGQRKLEIRVDWTLIQLLKATVECLDFSPKQTSEPQKAEKGIRQILSGIGTVVHGISELRNSYGTGHGKDASFRGLEPKYAKLLVGVVSELVILFLATNGEGAELIEGNP